MGSYQDGDVEIDDVWFAYPSRPNHMVLKVTLLNVLKGFVETYETVLL